MSLVGSIIYHISLLMALSMVYFLLQKHIEKKSAVPSVVIGIMTGIIGIGVMYNPYVLLPGVVFDVRSILLCISGLTIGFIPTAIAAVVTAVYRIIQGGAGTITGVSVILCSAISGLLCRRYYFDKMVANNKQRIFILYLLGVITHLLMLLCMLLMPWETAVQVFRQTALPIMILYPVGVLLLGLLLFNHIDNLSITMSLEENEERYRNIFNNEHTVMLLVDPETQQILDANPAAVKFYGWSLDELKAKKVEDIDTLTREEIISKIEHTVSENGKSLQFKHRLASGEIRDVSIMNELITIKGKQVLFTIVRDITNAVAAQTRLEESQERLRVTLLSVGDGVITTDREGHITLLNQVAKDITGWTEDVIGKPINSIFNIVNEYSGTKVDDPIQKVLETGSIVGLANHTVLICADGARKPIADSAAPIKDNEGNILGVVLIIRDVTREKKNRQEIEYLGYHDALTGLFNRRFFDEEVRRLDTARNLPISIIIGDVNSLKLTNDAFGHARGDRLLKEMAKQISKACRCEDIISRWGGDEFIMLLPKTDEKTAESICSRIRENCSKVRMSEINFSISLGYETKSEAGTPINDVIKRAEDYMYRNKSISGASLRRSNIDSILLALHEKSPREREHSNRVGELCRAIGQAMNLSEKDIDDLGLAGLMHDIGKIAITDTVLNKEGRLTTSEWVEMKRHPEIGYRILSASNNMSYIAEYVLMHHERLDGSGYPNGADEFQIPLQSRILAIADAFDAMTSTRPYRQPVSDVSAARELIRCSGAQFDPKIVDVFVEKVLKISRDVVSEAMDA